MSQYIHILSEASQHFLGTFRWVMGLTSHEVEGLLFQLSSQDSVCWNESLQIMTKIATGMLHDHEYS